MTIDVDIPAADEWRSCVAAFSDYNYFHFFDFGQCAAKRRNGYCENVVIRENQLPIGVAAVRIASIGPLGIAYIKGGPVCLRDIATYSRAFETCLEALLRRYVYSQGMLLRITAPVRSPEETAIQAQVLSKLGFRTPPFERPHQTIVKSLCGDEVDLKQSFAKKWTRELKASENVGLTRVSGTSDDLFCIFARLYQDLRLRKSFRVDQDVHFFRSVQSHLSEDEKFIVHISLLKGVPVSGYIGSIAGDTLVYVLGASSEEGRKCRAGYWLQWEAMRLAKLEGVKWYDLGGIDQKNAPDIARFKARMGGNIVTTNGPLELPRNILGLSVSTAASLIRRAAIMLKPSRR